MEYPKDRPKFFAQKVIRKMVKTCAASEMGQTAFMLVSIVATTEDAAGYTRPVTFFNEALLPLIGVRKWDTLDRARKIAIDAGWLEYEAPASGKRTPGRYWAKIPAHLEGLNDSPVDEEATKAYPMNGDALGKAYPSNGDASKKAYPVNGDGMGDAMGEPSSYTYTDKKEESDSSKTEKKNSAKGKTSKPKKVKSDFDPLAVDLPFDSDEFKEAWGDWVEYRISIKLPLTKLAATRQLNRCRKMGQAVSLKQIDRSITSGKWPDIYEPNDGKKGELDQPESNHVATGADCEAAGYTTIGFNE